MPAKSRKQQRWAFAVKGEKWAREHHMDELEKKKAHPKKVAKQAHRKRKRS